MINAIYLYRISRWLYLHHIPVLPKLITLLIFLIYNSKVSYKTEIGKGTRLGYGGIGVVIHQDAKIGKNVSLGPQVTIGGGNSKYPGLPIIGDNVKIHKGAIVMGGFVVGDNAEIGANSVVNKPVPANAVAVGVPAKIIRMKEQTDQTQTNEE